MGENVLRDAGRRFPSFGVMVFHDHEVGRDDNGRIAFLDHFRHHVATGALRRHLAELATDLWQRARRRNRDRCRRESIPGARISPRCPRPEVSETLVLPGSGGTTVVTRLVPRVKYHTSASIDIGDEELAVKLGRAERRGKGRPHGGNLPIEIVIGGEMESGERRDRRPRSPRRQKRREAALRCACISASLAGSAPRPPCRSRERQAGRKAATAASPSAEARAQPAVSLQ